MIRTHNHLVRKRTLNYLAKLASLTSLAKWLSVRLQAKWLWVRITLLSPGHSLLAMVKARIDYGKKIKKQQQNLDQGKEYGAFLTDHF